MVKILIFVFFVCGGGIPDLDHGDIVWSAQITKWSELQCNCINCIDGGYKPTLIHAYARTHTPLVRYHTMTPFQWPHTSS